MAALNAKQVNFRDGVYLSGVVKQSVGVNAPAGSTMGVTIVDKVEIVNHGVIVFMKGREFLVPWAAISSVELFTAEEQAARDAALEAETAPQKPAARR